MAVRILPLSIRAKLILAFVGLAALPMGALGWYGIHWLTDALTERALDRLSFEVANNAMRIEDFLANVQRDVRYLAGSFPVRNLADTINTSGHTAEYDVRRDELAQLLLRFLQGMPEYYEASYLDEQGREHVRLIAKPNHGPVIVPKEKLRDQTKYSDFHAAVQLAPGELYVSPMDFDVDPLNVESPPQPVVGYATPVVDRSDEKRGVLLIRIFAAHLVGLVDDRQASKGESFLLNSNGDYLYSAKLGGGFPDPARSVHVSQHYAPAIVDELLSREPDAILQPGGGIVVHASIPLLQANPKRFWVLGTSIPGEVVLQPIQKTRVLFLFILVGVIVGAAAIAISAAGSLHDHIQALRDGARMISEGNFGHRIHLETDDEIQDLGNQFNLMAEQVGEAMRKMERWNEDLQQEVARRTQELRSSEERLRIENRKLDDIMTGIGAEILLLDGSRNILWANKSYVENRNGPLNVLGRSCMELCKARGKSGEPCPALQTFQSGKMQSVVREQKQEGHDKFYQIITTPVADRSGGVFQVLELWLDITDSVERETAIRQQAAENEKLAALVQLSAGVIHEVANPLAAIRTTVDVMEKELPAGSVQRLEAVRNKIDDLGRFLRTFSLYARPGKPELYPADVLPILRSVVQLLEHEASRRGIVVGERYDEYVPIVQANPLQLQQVFFNLLSNAFDAMPDGGQVWISAEGQPDGTLTVSIADSGVGIPPGQLGRIFEPFFSTKPSGTGLGLAIVQQIIKAHGGELRVNSSPNSGTSFTIRFQAAAAQRAG